MNPNQRRIQGGLWGSEPPPPRTSEIFSFLRYKDKPFQSIIIFDFKIETGRKTLNLNLMKKIKKIYT